LRRPLESAQFTSIRYGERLAEIGAVPSIGTVGDSFDNALAETVNGYYKAELIRGPARRGPWKTIEEVELATLGWVHWHNTQRLHGYLGDLPPAEFEALHSARDELDPGVLSVARPTRRAAERPPTASPRPGRGPDHSRTAARASAADRDRVDRRRSDAPGRHAGQSND
jgi:Integrase core domain